MHVAPLPPQTCSMTTAWIWLATSSKRSMLLFQMIVDLVAAHELHGVAGLGALVERLEAALVDLVSAPFDAA